MKKILLLTVTLCLLLTGCADKTTEAFVGGSGYLYHDRYYYLDRNKICYISLETGEHELLCFDPLCPHNTNECIAFIENGAFSSLVVDEFASKDGPVLYVAAGYIESEEIARQELGGHTAIFRVDIVAGTRKTVAKDFGCSSINDMILKDGEFWFTALQDEKFDVYRMTGAEKVEKVMDLEEINTYVHAVQGDVLYVRDDLGAIWSAKFDEPMQKTFEARHRYGTYIHNGYIYYVDDEEQQLNENRELPYYSYERGEWGHYQWLVRSYTCYRIPMEDADAEPEVVAQNVMGSQAMLLHDGYLYLVEKGHRYLGSYTVYDAELKKELPMYSAVTTDAILRVNLNTLETERIALDETWEIFSIHAYFDGKILFRGVDMQLQIDQQGNSPTKYVVYDAETDDYTVLE